MEGRAPTDHQEVEWQFDVAEVEPVEGWLRRRPGSGLVVVPGPTEEIADAYYDSEDRSLHRAGYALRVREAGGRVECTIKSLTPAEDGLRRRREISEPLRDAEPATLGEAPGPVGETSRGLLGDRWLRRMFEIHTRRRRFALERAADPDDGAGVNATGGVRVGEVLIDTSEIPRGEGQEPARLWRVEVEASVGTTLSPDLLDFVGEMRSDLGLSPASVSKYEAGLQAAGLTPGRVEDIAREARGPGMAFG